MNTLYIDVYIIYIDSGHRKGTELAIIVWHLSEAGTVGSKRRLLGPARGGQAKFSLRSRAVNRGCPWSALNRNDPLIPYTAPARSAYARSR
jgi:hypothetical protein